MALRRAGQPLIRLGRIDQRLGETDLVLAREPHDLGVFDYAPCVLSGGGDDIAGQSQAAQAGGALHLVIDLDRDTRFQSGGLGVNLGLGHGGLLHSIIYGKMPYHSRSVVVWTAFFLSIGVLPHSQSSLLHGESQPGREQPVRAEAAQRWREAPALRGW